VKWLQPRLWRNKKGISPIISSVILVFTVLIVGVFIWWFAISQAGITSATYALEVRNSIEKIEERFVVEHVQITGTGPYTIKIWVYNYGKIAVNITKIYVESNLVLDFIPVEIFIDEMVQISVPSVVEPPAFIQVESERGTVVIGFP
jgi:hypothetical protein